MSIYIEIYTKYIHIFAHHKDQRLPHCIHRPAGPFFFPRQKGSRVISPRPCSSRRHLLRPVACWKTLARLPNSSTNRNNASWPTKYQLRLLQKNQKNMPVALNYQASVTLCPKHTVSIPDVPIVYLYRTWNRLAFWPFVQESTLDFCRILL